MSMKDCAEERRDKMFPLKKIQRIYDNIYNGFLFYYKKLDGFGRIDIRGRILIGGCRNPRISFGENIVINSSERANPAGGYRTILTVYESGQLTIGNNTGLSNSMIVCRKSVFIGSNVNIGANNVIYDTDMHSVDYEKRMGNLSQYVRSEPVVIEDGAWICGHCIILKGVHIGRRSVVAAGSVVTHDIPDNELWGGNPCKFIRKINRK